VEVANFLLITTAVSRERPRLYDRAAKQWVYSSDNAAAVMFWPRDIGRRREPRARR